jgi:hypothetical protein
MPRYGTVDHTYGAQLATCDPAADGPIYMLNLMKYRAVADYDGASGGDATEISGREADDIYSPVDVLHDIGAAITLSADVLDATEDWDRVAVVKYPTRRSFIEMQSRRDFQEKHTHKDAGMDHTIVLGTVPSGDLPSRAKPERLLLELWHGEEPSLLNPGGTGEFVVEGTIVGDGRAWSGARWTPIAPEATVVLPAPSPERQALVLQPSIDRWQ